jgi:hypothetical protein
MQKRGIIQCQISLENIVINNINNETENYEVQISSLSNVQVEASYLEDYIWNMIEDSPSFTPKIYKKYEFKT